MVIAITFCFMARKEAIRTSWNQSILTKRLLDFDIERADAMFLRDVGKMVAEIGEADNCEDENKWDKFDIVPFDSGGYQSPTSRLVSWEYPHSG